MEEELGLEPGGAVEAPEQLDDLPRQHPLQRALRGQVGEHVPLQLLERIHALVLQQHVAGGGQPVAERIGRRCGLAGCGLRPGALAGVAAVGFDLFLSSHDGSFRVST